MYTQTEKRQFIIFLLMAYGLTYVLGLLMWYGNASGVDVSAFPNAQMMYPAAGVALAYLITGKKEQKLPKAFYVVFIILTVIMALWFLYLWSCRLWVRRKHPFPHGLFSYRWCSSSEASSAGSLSLLPAGRDGKTVVCAGKRPVRPSSAWFYFLLSICSEK